MRRVLTLLMASFLLALSAAPALSQSDSAEVTFWQSVQDTKDPAELEAYPEGKFVPLARIRLKKLKPTGSAKAQDSPSSEDVADAREQLKLFGDVLERARDNFVVKPDDKELIRTAIEAIANSFPDDALADFKQSQLDKLQKLPATSDESQIYGALDVFGDVFDRWHTQRKPKASAKALIEAALDGMMSGLDPVPKSSATWSFSTAASSGGSESR